MPIRAANRFFLILSKGASSKTFSTVSTFSDFSFSMSLLLSSSFDSILFGFSSAMVCVSALISLTCLESLEFSVIVLMLMDFLLGTKDSGFRKKSIEEREAAYSSYMQIFLETCLVGLVVSKSGESSLTLLFESTQSSLSVRILLPVSPRNSNSSLACILFLDISFNASNTLLVLVGFSEKLEWGLLRTFPLGFTIPSKILLLYSGVCFM